MELNMLDKKAIIELKDEIAERERRFREVSTVTAKAGVPLEELLELSPTYKNVWGDTYDESEAQARALLGDLGKSDLNLRGKRSTYSMSLESGKTYEQVGEGVIGLFALKVMYGEGVFEFTTKWKAESRTHCTFTAIPEEKYVLFECGLVIPQDARFEVKELEGHIRYVLAMSTFLEPEIRVAD